MHTFPPIHTSPETASLMPDSPYGFRLRCQMRVWLESRKGHGYRMMTQTSNPKNAGLVWNKPKASIYSYVGYPPHGRGHVPAFHQKGPCMSLLPMPTHDYIGRKPCGCVVAVLADLPSQKQHTARMVAAFIRDGLAVERIALADLARYFPLGCRCTPGDGPQKGTG